MWPRRSVSVVATASAAIVMTSLAGCSGSAEPPVTAWTLLVAPQRQILRSVISLGRSVRGRPIRAIVLGDPHAARPVLVVGCIHGKRNGGDGCRRPGSLRGHRPEDRRSGSSAISIPTVSPQAHGKTLTTSISIATSRSDGGRSVTQATNNTQDRGHSQSPRVASHAR